MSHNPVSASLQAPKRTIRETLLALRAAYENLGVEPPEVLNISAETGHALLRELKAAEVPVSFGWHVDGNGKQHKTARFVGFELRWPYQ